MRWNQQSEHQQRYIYTPFPEILDPPLDIIAKWHTYNILLVSRGITTIHVYFATRLVPVVDKAPLPLRI